MLDKMNYFSHELMMNYPSGMKTQTINAGRLFNDTDEKYFLVGNGAAELINCLGKTFAGKMLISKTSFNEYYRCFDNVEFDVFDMKNNDYKFDLDLIYKKIDEDDIICIVNPDNPTGAFIEKEDIIKILDRAKELNKRVIFDESFIDFANKDIRYTLIDNEVLDRYPNLVVIKSISKSYGIPGLRLGVMATSDYELLADIKKKMAVWNINSYGEYFLQIDNLFKKDYVRACDQITDLRKGFTRDLRKIKNLKVYDSQANYVLCYLNGIDSTDVAIELLDDDIFIKDLKTKSAFKDENYIRLAIRKEEENKKLCKSLKRIIEK